jgi:hypothetical protein
MTRDELAELVLLEIDRRYEAARAAPEPPRWRWWLVEDRKLDLEYGPSYSPKWFGKLAETEAGRVRFLRCIYKLSAGGLVVLVKSEGGRLERLRLTPAGVAAVAELRGESVPVPS